ncbi:3-phosphoglycerate kinase [Stutzerimonas zhaodongensis]|uniref:3-phosphoglycerate kinase n=1 Tax=Stutzerimonas TaxID=2901164 RepID=UPI00388DD918
MNKVCFAALAAALASATMFPPSALAVSYPVDLEQELNGTEVMASPETIDRDMAGLVLQNLGDRPVECSAAFRNGPELPRTRRLTLEPGQSKPMTAKFKRDVIRLRIKLTCEPQ